MNSSPFTYYHVSHLVILFSGFFSWMLALGQISLQNRRINNYLLIVMLVLVGIVQINIGLDFMYPDTNNRSIFSMLIYPSSFLLGPLMYFYFQYIIYQDFSFSPWHLIHFIPGLAATLVIFFIHYHFKGSADAVLNMPYSSVSLSYLVVHSAMAVVLIYCIIICVKLSILYRKMQPRRKEIIRPGLLLVTISILVYLSWFVHAIFYIENAEISYLLISVLMFSLYIISNRYPEYMHILRLEASRLGYIRSQVKDIDVQGIISNIQLLCETEKIYCDEEISLKSLADEVSVTPHQLSEILNEHLNKNFYQFINEYRIRESEEILVQEPGRSILSVATAVGFNSPSAFYSAFRKITGETPTQYRKRKLKA